MRTPFKKLLVANRGEIACRIFRTARRMGIATVAVYSDADAVALHVGLADEAVHIGASAPAESYLRIDAIVSAARATGAEAVHPGYGFLSENPEFVEAVEAAGLVFVGPPASAIRVMGLKDAAKRLMQDAGVPVVPGYHGEDQDPALLAAKAGEIGYPVLIKARAGGGGKGMRKVEDPGHFDEALASAKREARSAFGDDAVLIEKYILSPRHIEVQVFGDNHGNVVHLFERDCSLQRRHQKVIEEAPAPGMTDAVRSAMTAAAVKAAKAIGYSGAGTIEFIADGSGALRPDGFWFMEMNTRLQVEHPVTEAITGQDLVEWQLRVAAGEELPLTQQALSINGHAFEARLYAEDPANGFLPVTGKLHGLSFGGDARVDAGVRPGDVITPWYDPMIAKIVTHGSTRAEALRKLKDAVGATHVAGTASNAAFLARLAAHEDFAGGAMDTGLIDRSLDRLARREPLPEPVLALAAVVALDLDPSDPLTGWRLWGGAHRRVRFVAGGETLHRNLILNGEGKLSLRGGPDDVDLHEVVRLGTRAAARLGPTARAIEVEVIRVPHAGGMAFSVLSDGNVHELLLPDPLLAASHHADHSDDVLAPMTGVVRLVGVRPGDTVDKGDRLLVMEAMKMETSIAATRNGVVSEIHCSEGQTVEGGMVIIRFAEAAE